MSGITPVLLGCDLYTINLLDDVSWQNPSLRAVHKTTLGDARRISNSLYPFGGLNPPEKYESVGMIIPNICG